MNPWVQRILISLGAGVAASSFVVGTAKNKHKKAKKKRRKKSDPPITIGTVAKREAGEDFVPGMTGKELLANIKAIPSSFVSFFKKKPQKIVDDDGVLHADEIKNTDGTTIKPKKERGKPAKPLTAAERRRRRKKRRRDATLFESARESFRQVVKEEANKAIDEKVEQTGLKQAADVVKQGAEKAGATVKEAASKIKESIPEDAEEKIQKAGLSFLAGAKKLGQQIGAGVSQAVQALQENAATPPPVDSTPPVDVTPPPTELIPPEHTLAPMPQATPTPPQTTALEPQKTQEPPAASAPPPPPPASALPVEEGMTAEQLKGTVQDGVKKIGAFLSGPGNPGYKKSGRLSGASGGDVVEAKDPNELRRPNGEPPKEPPQ